MKSAVDERCDRSFTRAPAQLMELKVLKGAEHNVNPARKEKVMEGGGEGGGGAVAAGVQPCSNMTSSQICRC